MIEIFKPVVGFEGAYEISNLGNVKSLSRYIRTTTCKAQKRKIRERIVAPAKRPNGYLFVHLKDKEKEKRASIHRLVAGAFIPNPMNKPQVNHINGNKADNRLENLEWVTASENTKHTFDVLGRKIKKGAEDSRSKRVYQYDQELNLIKEFGSIGEVRRELGIFSSTLKYCCQRKSAPKRYSQYIFSYEKLTRAA